MWLVWRAGRGEADAKLNPNQGDAKLNPNQGASTQWDHVFTWLKVHVHLLFMHLSSTLITTTALSYVSLDGDWRDFGSACDLAPKLRYACRFPLIFSLIAALESEDAHQVESVCRSNRATLLPPSGKGDTPANLWGFKTESGYCPVQIQTKCSDRIDNNVDVFVLPTQEKIHPASKFTWSVCTNLIDSYLECDEITELCTVLRAGLVPYSMAGDLGEEERKSACKNGIYTFALEDPLLSTLPDNFADDADGQFFGVPGYTKVSHMLTVKKRSSCWTEPVAGDDFVVHGMLALLVQSWPRYFRELPIGMRVADSCYNVFYTFNGLHSWPKIFSEKRGEKHNICFVIVAALLVADRLYAHTHQRGSLNAKNGRLVANPVCIGGKIKNKRCIKLCIVSVNIDKSNE
jgi:hypothetical protein